MNIRDVELLSAYLDGELNPSEAARLETRLSSDPNLKASLEDLRQTRGLLRKLPQRRAPRNFRLTPRMAGLRPPEPRAYPVFRLATVLAGLLFVGSVALNAVTPFAARHLAPAAAPAYGVGGGGGGYGGGPTGEQPPPGLGRGGSGQFTEAAPAATQAPAATAAPAQPLAALPTGTPEALLGIAQATPPPAEDSTRTAEGVPNTEASKSAPSAATGPSEQNQLPVPLPWVAALGAVMLVFAAAAWLLRRNSERRFRDRWNQK